MPRETIMAAHTPDQRAFIVARLAAFDNPQRVAALFARRYPDTLCSEADVYAADPRVSIVDPMLHALFISERARVLADEHSAPYAEQKARLVALSSDAEHYGENNQRADRRAVFRQIAEELGVGGKAGGKANGPDAATPEFRHVEVTHTIVDPKADAA